MGQQYIRRLDKSFRHSTLKCISNWYIFLHSIQYSHSYCTMHNCTYNIFWLGNQSYTYPPLIRSVTYLKLNFVESFISSWILISIDIERPRRMHFEVIDLPLMYFRLEFNDIEFTFLLTINPTLCVAYWWSKYSKLSLWHWHSNLNYLANISKHKWGTC